MLPLYIFLCFCNYELFGFDITTVQFSYKYFIKSTKIETKPSLKACMLKELYVPRECYSQQKQPPDVFHKKRFSLSKRYWTPEKACNFVFSTETQLKKYDFKKNRKSRSCLDQKLCQFLFYSLWCHLRQTIKIESKFLRNSSLHRNKRLLIYGQFFFNLLEVGTKWEIL